VEENVLGIGLKERCKVQGARYKVQLERFMVSVGPDRLHNHPKRSKNAFRRKEVGLTKKLIIFRHRSDFVETRPPSVKRTEQKRAIIARAGS